jgi:hypothetical protein
MWLRDREQALDPRWDHLRHAVLGQPFRGYLLQHPFTAAITRRLDIHIDLETPKSPVAMTFVMGGVGLALPLAPGVAVAHADVAKAGWECLHHGFRGA